jgi:hypothetical protein
MAAVQCAHDANPREHRRATEISHQYQRLDCGLPFGQGGFLLRQPGNVGRGVAQLDEHAPVRQLDRILKPALPAFAGRQ